MTKPRTRRKPDDERRETLLSTRVTTAEEGAVVAWGAARGLGRSEAVRQLIEAGLGRRKRAREAAPRIDPETVRVLAELTNPSTAAINRLGNVVDQVARKLHTGGHVSEMSIVALLDAFEEVREEQQRIGGMLSVGIETLATLRAVAGTEQQEG